MANTVQIKRGNTASVSSYTGPSGEVIYNTDTNRLHSQDGSVAGGHPHALMSDVNTKANSSVTITAGTGLTGGGNLTANRTLALNSASIASLAKADSSVQTVNGVSPVAGNVTVAAEEKRLQDTRTTAIAESFPSNVQFVETAGYSSVGDGGGALYKRVSSEPTHAGKFQSADGAWWELSEKNPSVAMFGVFGTGSDESTELNAGIAYCATRRIRELFVPYLMKIKAESIVNPNGVLLTGDGIVNAGNVKYNARSDEHEPWVDGLEYLWVAHKILSTPGSLHKTLLVGDSTVYGAYIGMAPDNRLPVEHQPQSILYRLGIEHGVGWHQVINGGVNGTTVANLDTSLVTADSTINTLIIKYMINDASFPPDGDSVKRLPQTSDLSWQLSGQLAA